MRVLIAGLAGASLGTEILKSLKVAGGYEIFGCDVSPLAYGLYSKDLSKSFVVDQATYIDSVIKICIEHHIDVVVPGGEQPMVLLAAHTIEFSNQNILVLSNSSAVVKLFSDKYNTFDFLKSKGFKIPQTLLVSSGNFAGFEAMQYPCIVKPSSGTGGSDSVFLASNKDECMLYSELLLRNGRPAIIQEYIDLKEGEFTIGIVSDKNSNVISSIAMRRIFSSKLSISYKGKKGLISSGYSQGLIADFREIRTQAEAIARAAQSTGPLNVQGRVKNGVLIPFEINPRFSASTYLRTLAGVNEIHLYLQHLMGSRIDGSFAIKEGYYLRSFEEMFVPNEKIK